MTSLAVREARHVAQHSGGRPVAARGEGHAGRDRLPPRAGSRTRVTEPTTRTAAELKGKKADGAVGVVSDEPLRATACHVPPANYAIHYQRERCATLLRNDELISPPCNNARRHQGIAKANGAAVERRKQGYSAGRTAGAAMRGARPRGEFRSVTAGTPGRSHEIRSSGARNKCVAAWRG